jgi:hypothetical protein
MKSSYKDFTTCQLYIICMDYFVIKNIDNLQILYDVDFLKNLLHLCTHVQNKFS